MHLQCLDIKTIPTTSFKTYYTLLKKTLKNLHSTYSGFYKFLSLTFSYITMQEASPKFNDIILLFQFVKFWV